MKTTFARHAWLALLVPIGIGLIAAQEIETKAKAATPAIAGTASTAAATPAAKPDKPGELAALEKMLLGDWRGGACVGNYTFNADGTFELKHYTPGVNTLTGTWSIRWNALPPTLVLVCKTSDFKTKDPTREEYEHLGKPLELKLLELNSDTFVYRLAKDKAGEQGELHYKRPTQD